MNPAIDQRINLGALQSEPDYRDAFAAQAAAAAVAASVGTISLPHTFPPVLDSNVLMQGQRPACVSHSVVDLLKLYWYRRTGKWIAFSPRFVDAYMKTIDGLGLNGTGAYPRLAFKTLAKVGCATEDVLPNDITLSDEEYRNPAILTPAVMANAAQYKIPGYIQVALDPLSTREAIYLYGAVSTLFQIGAELWTNSAGQSSWADKDIDPLRTPAKVVSGHQMSPCGWNDEPLNIIQNEWSKDWANGGRNRYDPTPWRPYIIEQWAIADIPQDAAALLATLPSPSDFHYRWETNLHVGDNNIDVKFAQIALMILGYLSPIPAAELGIYGPKTAAAVAKFQAASGIKPTVGTSWGPLTRAAANARFAV